VTVIVDAILALKSVIEEEGSDAAGVLLLEEPLAAPNLLSMHDFRRRPAARAGERR
jgi:hypothetical protein